MTGRTILFIALLAMAIIIASYYWGVGGVLALLTTALWVGLITWLWRNFNVKKYEEETFKEIAKRDDCRTDRIE